MFDIAPSELLLVAIVALVFIGPKDLPRAMQFVGKWVGRARGVARQFRSGLDAVVREAELAELEKQWAAENERIMRQYPPQPLPAPEEHPVVPAADAVTHAVPHDEAAPVMTPQPVLRSDPAPHDPAQHDPMPHDPVPHPTEPKAAPLPPTDEAKP